MKVVYNSIIPFRGYKAISLFGIVFVRNGCFMTSRDLRHEEIHFSQQREMLFVFFYLWYFVEWLIKLFKYNDFHEAYKNISFEREAYCKENVFNYLDIRDSFEWFNYL